jgi:hypothetical protein
VTAKDIDSHLNRTPRAKKMAHTDFTIDLSGLENHQKLEIYKQLQTLQKQFGFMLTASEGVMAIAGSVATAANDNDVPNGTQSVVAS